MRSGFGEDACWSRPEASNPPGPDVTGTRYPTTFNALVSRQSQALSKEFSKVEPNGLKICHVCIDIFHEPWQTWGS